MAVNIHRIRPTAKARLPFTRPRESGWRSGPPRKWIAAGLVAVPVAAGAAGAASRHRIVRTTARGYRRASQGERAGFGLLFSFALAIGAARAITYVREQRRPVRPFKNLSGGPYRVHHYLPGIGLVLVGGTLGLITGDERLKPWLALCLGAGTGLTLDEAAVLIEREDVYWNTERLSFAEALLALGGAAALAARFFHRANSSHPSRPSTGESRSRAPMNTVDGYCARERKKVDIDRAEAVVTKDGRPAIRGVCPDCGAKIFRFGRLE
jgi:hypothetical protein